MAPIMTNLSSVASEAMADPTIAMHHAAKENHVEDLLAAIHAGARINDCSGDLQRTALHAAAEKGILEAAKVLLAFGADPNLCDAEGRTASQIALNAGQPHIVFLLKARSNTKRIQSMPSRRRSSANTSRRAALVIGNAHYPYQTLTNAITDTQVIAATLESLRFEVFVGHDLTIRRLIDDFRKFVENLGREDFALVYFVGLAHRQGNRSLLCGVDRKFEATPSESLTLEAIIDTLLQRPGREEMADEVQGEKGASLVIIDACRDIRVGNHVEEVVPAIDRYTGQNTQYPFGGSSGRHTPQATLSGRATPIGAYTNGRRSPQRMLPSLADPRDGVGHGHSDPSDTPEGSYCRAKLPREVLPGLCIPDLRRAQRAAVLFSHTPSALLADELFDEQAGGALLRPLNHQLWQGRPMLSRAGSAASLRSPVSQAMSGIPSPTFGMTASNGFDMMAATASSGFGSAGAFEKYKRQVNPAVAECVRMGTHEQSKRCSISRRLVTPIQGATWPGVLGWDSMGETAKSFLPETLGVPEQAAAPSLFAYCVREALKGGAHLRYSVQRVAAKVLEDSGRRQKPCAVLSPGTELVLL